MPTHGLCLRDRIENAQEPTVVAEPENLEPDEPRHATSTYDVRFALGHEALVVTADVVRLGLAGPLPVALPVAAPLHRQHALLTRHRGRYWLLPFPHHHDVVAVNGAASASPRLLQDGDELAFGSSHCDSRCRFQFRQTAGSGTAVLQARKQPVLLPDGRTF